MQKAVALALVAGFAACGGGGGGEPQQQPASMVPLTAGNMDAAAHAAMVGPFAFGVSSVVVGAGGPSATGLWVGRVMGALPGGRMQALALARPLTLYPSQPQACPAGGTLTLSIDDRNENLDFDVGDVTIFDFDRCQMTPYDMTNGRAAVELLRVDPNGFGGRMVMTQMSDRTTDGRHSVTIDGTALMDYAETAGTGSSNLQMRAEGAMTIAVATHTGYNDSVTLQPGFWQQSSYDGMQGMGSTTFGGDLASVAAGGMMSVSTKAAFVDRDADGYPMSGTAQVRGRSGVLSVTALSPNEVKVGLDDNDCGVDEHTQRMTWDGLF